MTEKNDEIYFLSGNTLNQTIPVNMEYSSTWEQLTDPLLIQILAYLDAPSLFTVSLICKHWNKVTQDEFLWKNLVFSQLGKEVSLRKDISTSWKEEYKRLTYNVPIVVSESLSGHTDKIFYVCFSPSGRYIATCGADGLVKIWEFGSPTKLYTSVKLCTAPAYVNYVEFNQSETRLLINCIWKEDETVTIQAVLSVNNELKILGARFGYFFNFRGTWLDDERFVGADVCTYFFDLGSIKFCTFKVHEEDRTNTEIEKVTEDVDVSVSITDHETEVPSGGEQEVDGISSQCIESESETKPGTTDESEDSVFSQSHSCHCDVNKVLLDYCGDDNVDIDVLFECHDLDYSPQFVKIMDMKKWNSLHKDSSMDFSDQTHVSYPDSYKTEKQEEENDNDKIMIVFQVSFDNPGNHHIAFFQFSSQASANNHSFSTEPFKVIVLKSGFLGVSLSPDQRYLACNIRKIEIHGESQWYNLNVDTLVVDLFTGCQKKEHYSGNIAVEETFNIYYFFANVSNQYIASGSERGCGYIWDRHYGTMLQVLPHMEPGPKQVSVSAVVFHPSDEEVLVTVADDYLLRVWRSKERQKIHSRSIRDINV